MRKVHFLVALALVGLAAGLTLPASAQTDAGVVLWRHSTDMEVKSATDFDGSDITADGRGRNWDIKGSGIGVRAQHRFAGLVSLYGILGASQMTIRDEDIGDPSLDVDARGFSDDPYVLLGARLGDHFPQSDKAFWSAGVTASFFSSDAQRDVDRAYHYSERTLALRGTAGYTVYGLGLYGGLRAVWMSADLEETNVANPFGQQLRSFDMERDGQVDFLLGMNVGTGSQINGYFELGLVGTFSAVTGLSYQF
jgi:hypothetical protein